MVSIMVQKILKRSFTKIAKTCKSSCFEVENLLKVSKFSVRFHLRDHHNKDVNLKFYLNWSNHLDVVSMCIAVSYNYGYHNQTLFLKYLPNATLFSYRSYDKNMSFLVIPKSPKIGLVPLKMGPNLQKISTSQISHFLKNKIPWIWEKGFHQTLGSKPHQKKSTYTQLNNNPLHINEI